MLERSAFERIQVHRGECFFPENYEDGSKNFVSAAIAAGAEVSSMPVGEGLNTDVAIFRTGADPNRFLVHLSGTHGPEGYVGSAIQNAALQFIKANKLYQSAAEAASVQHDVEVNADGTGASIEPQLQQQEHEQRQQEGSLLPTLVFVHAVNPFGFKHHRRVNEDNVDLNRNFLSPEEWQQVKALDPNYARHLDFKDVINPTSRSFPYIWLNDLYTMALSGYYMLRHGKNSIKTALVSGNYLNPTGYSYGGQAHTQSTRNLMDLLLTRLDLPHQAEQLVLIDVHSGLGPAGVDTLLDVGFSPQAVEKVFPTEYNSKGVAIGALKSSTGTAPATASGASTAADSMGSTSAGTDSDKVVEGVSEKKQKQDTAAATAAAEDVSKGYEMVKGVITGNFCNNMLAPNLTYEDKLCVAQVGTRTLCCMFSQLLVLTSMHCFPCILKGVWNFGRHYCWNGKTSRALLLLSF